MALPATIRVNIAAPFPAQVQGAGGIKVTKANGKFTVSPDFAALASIGAVTPASKQVWVFDPATGIYNTMTLASVGQSFGLGIPLDVFLLAGSSNTVGWSGSTGSAPAVPPGMVIRYNHDGTISDANDPQVSAVSASTNWNSQTGSMWPAFGIAYGRRVGLVMTAVGGSTQCAAADFGVGNGNWQDTGPGSNYANSLIAINAALAAFTAAGYTPTFRGTIINELGVNDAIQIDAGISTVGQYTAAFTAMAANYRAATIGGAVYPHMPIFMSLAPTNTNPAQPEFPGYAQVRSAQIAICAADGNTLMTNNVAVTFGQRGLLQTNSVHPTQPGYNEWGYILGGAVLPYVNRAVGPTFGLINQNTAAAPLPTTGFNTLLQLNGADNGITNIEVLSHGTGLPSFLTKHAGGTGAVPTQTLLGNVLGNWSSRGYGATGYAAASNASLSFFATQNFTDTAQGTKAAINITPNGTAASKLVALFDQDGSFTIGLSGTFTATMKWAGSTSGLITVQAQAAAGTFNFNLPTSAGAVGQALLSGGGGAAAMSFGTLGVSGGGTGITAGSPWIISPPTTVNFAATNTDFAISTPLPPGYTQIGFITLTICDASGNISTATFGLNTDVAGGGAAIIPAATAISVTSGTANTNNNMQTTNVTNIATQAFTPVNGAIQFRIGSTVAQTAKVFVAYKPIP